MSEHPIREDSTDESKGVTGPYPPSWLDRLIAWIRNLPGPSWLAYLAIFLASVFFNTGMYWLDGSLRPILKLSDAEYSSIAYQLTTLPRRLGFLALLVGPPFGIMSVVANPTSWDLSGSSSMFMIVYRGAIAVSILTFSAVFFLHTIHQLRVVDRLQRMPSKISLFHPLLGMHERLVAEKARALRAANERIELIIDRLHGQVDSGTSEATDLVNKNLASLLLEAETLSKKSTWPWRPETLRGFLGAITLPVVVWLITTALDRMILR